MPRFAPAIPTTFAAMIPAVLTPGAALAHPGHLAEVAGHGHWLGAAALGAAIAIGLWASLRPRAKQRPEDEAADSEEELPEEELQDA
ncbi:DUF6732 family protein [Pseudooceanicola aestuarii]|uniref:DUF6732 family protein n=1 Tax=Pseudooceanicola aestuarii TaxID=2697319 RepID=UPI001EF7C39E|nr:DUF6732 family protein [Pseudooceanicola aestuarii]